MGDGDKNERGAVAARPAPAASRYNTYIYTSYIGVEVGQAVTGG